MAKKINLPRTPLEHKIAKEFFLDYTTGAEISRKMYPNAFNPRKTRLPKIKNVGAVSGLFNKWKKAGYIDEKMIMIMKINKKGTEYFQKIPVYRLNLNPFFDNLKERKINLEEPQKGFLKLVFEIKEKDLRKDVYKMKDDLFFSINYVLTKYLIFNLKHKIKMNFGGNLDRDDLLKDLKDLSSLYSS